MKRILCLWFPVACGPPAGSCDLPADCSALAAGDARSADAKQPVLNSRPRQTGGRSRTGTKVQHAPIFGIGCENSVWAGDAQAAQRQSWLETFHRLAELCRQFSPTVGVIGADLPDSLLLDVTGTAHLFGGETALAERLTGEIAQYFAGDPQVGTKQPGSSGAEVYGAIADTPGGAWAIARWCTRMNWPAEWIYGSGRWVIVPAGRTPEALRRLPIEALRLEAETVEMLGALALRQIYQLEVLPRSELAARFGQRLLDRLDQALGRLEEPLLPLEPTPRFAAELTLCYPTGNREYLEAILERLLCQVAVQLREAGCGAMRLECHLRCGSQHGAAAEGDTAISGNHSDKQTLRLELGLFEPLCDATQLFQLLGLQLERLRLPGPVSAVHVEATTAARLPQQQTRLFAAGETAGGDRRQLAVLVNRLCARLGWQSVLGVQPQPEAQPELAFCYVPLVVPSLEDPKGTTAERHIQRSINRQAAGGAKKILLADFHRAATGARWQSGQMRGEVLVRPLRLLRRPVAVEGFFAQNKFSGPGEPTATRAAEGALPPQFRWQGRLYRVRRAWGPERIQTGWWRGRPVGRDYYQIETTTGRRLWMFRQLDDGRWFVHGLFD